MDERKYEVNLMFNLTKAIVFVISLCLCSLTALAKHNRHGEDRTLRVMSFNTYVGGSINAVVEKLFIYLSDPTNQNLANYLVAAGTTYQMFQNNVPDERMKGFVQKVKQYNPDVIGLQELVMIRNTYPYVLTNPADALIPKSENIVQDQLSLILGYMQSMGLHYEIAYVQWLTEAETPALDVNDFSTTFSYRGNFRNAVLVRSDREDLKVQKLEGLIYDSNSQGLPGTVAISGAIIADLEVSGVPVRVINTHLERADTCIRRAQAEELLKKEILKKRKVKRNVILMGDLNTTQLENAPLECNDQTTYEIFTSKKLIDILPVLSPGEQVFTYGHGIFLGGSDTDELDERIDHVLYSGRNLSPVDIDYFNDEEADRTPSGFWLSDHVGVVGTFQVSGRRH